MYNVSNSYRNAIQKSCITSKVRGTITTKNGTNINFNSSDILSGSLSIDNACADGQELTLGSVYAGQAQFSVKTELDRYSFYGAKVTLIFSLLINESENVYEDVPLGVFYVAEAERSGKYVALKCYDAMLDFDENLNISTMGSLYDLLKISCQNCHVTMAQTKEEIDAMSPYDELDSGHSVYQFVVSSANNLGTYRALISEIAMLLSGFAYIDRFGNLRIGRLNNIIDGYEIDDKLRKGGKIYDYICEMSGVEASDSAKTYIAGDNTKTMIDLGQLNLIEDGLESFKQGCVNNVYNAIKNLVYTPAQIDFVGDPALDLGDLVVIKGYNADENGTKLCIMSYNWHFHGNETISAIGKNIKLSNAKNGSNGTMSRNEAMSQIDSAKNKFINFENATQIAIGNTDTLLVQIAIPTDADTSVLITGAIIISVTTPGTFKVIYKLDGDEFSFKPRQICPVSGDYTIPVLFNINGISADVESIFNIYITSVDGEGTIESGDCRIAINGSNLVSSSNWSGKIYMEETIGDFKIESVHTMFVDEYEDILDVNNDNADIYNFEEIYNGNAFKGLITNFSSFNDSVEYQIKKPVS